MFALMAERILSMTFRKGKAEGRITGLLQQVHNHLAKIIAIDASPSLLKEWEDEIKNKYLFGALNVMENITTKVSEREVRRWVIGSATYHRSIVVALENPAYRSLPKTGNLGQVRSVDVDTKALDLLLVPVFMGAQKERIGDERVRKLSQDLVAWAINQRP